MKSEERHQLLQNDLRVVTTKTVGFVERHLGAMIAVVVGLLLVLAVTALWNRFSQTSNAAGWTMLSTANSLDDFDDIVEKFKGQPPAQWAQLQFAEKTLQSAMPLMFTNREIALADLNRTREAFDSLLQDKTVPPVIRERALWGLALTLETGCDGDTSKPVEAYERLLKEFPDSIFKAVAEERIQSLKKPASREFYTWFSKENPKPPDARPKDIKSDGFNPHDSKMIEDEPEDFQRKKMPAEDWPSPEKTDAAPEDHNKKDDAAKPTEKPDAEKPADPNKAADPEKPTDKDAPGTIDKPPEKPSGKN